MGFRIVMDSCGELTDEMKRDSRFVSVPLTLRVGDMEFVDDDSFNQQECLRRMDESEECPRSACPSPEKYMEIFLDGAERYYVVTLSGHLSGSYNSARLGMEMAVEQKPELQIHIFDSRSASIGETLTAAHLLECEERGMDFLETVKDTERYIRGRKTFFVLENLETLRKNGRLSNLKAFVASALKIKPVMGATPEGTICQLDQARGINKALMKMVDYIVKEVKEPEKKVLGISHCNCPERAEIVRDAILERIKVKDSVILDTRGVSSMYANDGGVIVVI